MSGLAALDSGWPVPAGTSRRATGQLVLLRAGVLWDAVRTPIDVGLPVLYRLVADPDDRALLGPVLADRQRGWLYWLVSPGASDDWPDDVRLLRTESWLAAPRFAFSITPHAAWVHLPGQHVVSGPAWLAAVLRRRDLAGAA
jgi:hypothetical protein